MIKCFWADEGGATAIEYGLLVGGISIAIVVGLNAFSQELVETKNFLVENIGGG